MIKKRKQNKSAKNNKRQQGQKQYRELSSDAQIYSGPFPPLPAEIDQERLYTVQMSNTFAATAGAGTTLALVVGTALSSLQDNVALAGLFLEFRLLCATCEYVPNTQSALQTGANYAPLYGVVDRISGSTLSSAAAAVNYESCKVKSLDQPLRLTYRMSGSEDAEFTSVITTSNCNFKYFAGPVTAAVNYGVFILKTLVQFRGRF